MGAPTGLSTVGARSKSLSDDVYGRSSARTLAKGVATKGNRRKPDRKASQRKATDESPTERRRNERQPTKACLPRHGPFAHPVCVAARKPHFRPGNPPRHVRISTSVCVAAQKPHFRPGNPSRHIRSGTSVCAATSGDDPSSSTSAQRGAPVTAGKTATSKMTIERITLEMKTIECGYGHQR